MEAQVQWLVLDLSSTSPSNVLHKNTPRILSQRLMIGPTVAEESLQIRKPMQYNDNNNYNISSSSSFLISLLFSYSLFFIIIIIIIIIITLATSRGLLGFWAAAAAACNPSLIIGRSGYSLPILTEKQSSENSILTRARVQKIKSGDHWILVQIFSPNFTRNYGKISPLLSSTK